MEFENAVCYYYYFSILKYNIIIYNINYIINNNNKQKIKFKFIKKIGWFFCNYLFPVEINEWEHNLNKLYF